MGLEVADAFLSLAECSAHNAQAVGEGEVADVHLVVVVIVGVNEFPTEGSDLEGAVFIGAYLQADDGREVAVARLLLYAQGAVEIEVAESTEVENDVIKHLFHGFVTHSC